MTLLTKTKSHVLKKYDGTKIFVSGAFAELVMNGKAEGKKGTFYMSDGVRHWLDYSAICEVQSVSSYYKENPKSKPQRYKQFKRHKKTKPNRTEAIVRLMEGLEKASSGSSGPLIDRMMAALQEEEVKRGNFVG